jgi:hypothetical protein
LLLVECLPCVNLSTRAGGDVSLGIVFKGPEGIVLAADSRVTLNATQQSAGGTMIIPTYYDNATKLLHVAGQNYIGVVTFGAGAIGQPEPRTAQSFLPEFEANLLSENVGRLSVDDFAARLSTFFMAQWSAICHRIIKGQT